MKTLCLSIAKKLAPGIICVMLILAGCSKDTPVNQENNLSTNESFIKNELSLTTDEEESLMFMVEEEKLAMDVYSVMLDLYGLQIFDHIIKSELRHVEAVSRLIEKYNLVNPVTGNPPGEFENEELQQLYSELIALGTISKTEALNVGVIIESTDIVDIQYYLDNVVEQANIEQVYSNLLAGSYNHLSAFEHELENYITDVPIGKQE